jgi:hypothetical protein
MRFSSLNVARLTIPILSIALLCGPGGTGTSQATILADSTTSLPNVVVEAPKQVAKPQKPDRHAGAPSIVAYSTVSPRASSTAWECIGGCVTSFRSGDRPWVGCSVSGVTASSTCRNIGPDGRPYKTYNECMMGGQNAGWRTNEVSWYCNSLAFLVLQQPGVKVKIRV